MIQDVASSSYDLIVMGSGATGGWAAKRAAEAGLRVALVEAGRTSDDTDYREHVAASALPYRGRSEGPLTLVRPPTRRVRVTRRFHLRGLRHRARAAAPRPASANEVRYPGRVAHPRGVPGSRF